MKGVGMYHEDLKEWLLEHRLTQQKLAEDVGVANLTHYFARGNYFKPEYIEVWRKKYAWSDEQVFLFQFGRHFKPKNLPIMTEEEKRKIRLFEELKEVILT